MNKIKIELHVKWSDVTQVAINTIRKKFKLDQFFINGTPIKDNTPWINPVWPTYPQQTWTTGTGPVYTNSGTIWKMK